MKYSKESKNLRIKSMTHDIESIKMMNNLTGATEKNYDFKKSSYDGCLLKNHFEKL